jgi:hypothetical protein
LALHSCRLQYQAMLPAWKRDIVISTMQQHEVYPAINSVDNVSRWRQHSGGILCIRTQALLNRFSWMSSTLSSV